MGVVGSLCLCLGQSVLNLPWHVKLEGKYLTGGLRQWVKGGQVGGAGSYVCPTTLVRSSFLEGHSLFEARPELFCHMALFSFVIQKAQHSLLSWKGSDVYKALPNRRLGRVLLYWTTLGNFSKLWLTCFIQILKEWHLGGTGFFSSSTDDTFKKHRGVWDVTMMPSAPVKCLK